MVIGTLWTDLSLILLQWCGTSPSPNTNSPPIPLPSNYDGCMALQWILQYWFIIVGKIINILYLSYVVILDTVAYISLIHTKITWIGTNWVDLTYDPRTIDKEEKPFSDYRVYISLYLLVTAVLEVWYSSISIKIVVYSSNSTLTLLVLKFKVCKIKMS